MRLDEATGERSKLQADKKFCNNKVVKNKVITIIIMESIFILLLLGECSL